MNPRVKKIIPALLLLAVGGLALRWHLTKADDTTGGTSTLYGNIEIRQAGLSFTEQERIAEVLVEEGQSVASGQVLARLSPQRLMAQIREVTANIDAQKAVVNKLEAGSRPQEIQQARADVAAAKAQLQNAKNTFDRIRRTSGVGATSAQSLDDARARLEVSQAQLTAKQKALELAVEGPRKEDIAAAKNTLEALNAALALLKVRQEDLTLTAPAPGIIQSRILEPGELATPNRPVVTLALTDPKWVRTFVAEPSLGQVRPNQRARIVSDSFPEDAFEGWVGFISPTAEFTPKSVETEDLRTQLVYEMRVLVKDPENRLRLGMPVTVHLDSPAKQTASARE